MDASMEKLLPYYERELSQLRRAGADFAGRYPKLAGSLQIRGETCADPHVERLIQACAFLNARVAQRLDDGHARFTEALLGMLYPYHLRPMPSCSIARIDYSGAPKNSINGVTVLPRGAAMKSLAPGVASCGFRTVYDTAIAAVAISAAWFEPHIQVPATMPLPPDAGAALCITIESTGAARGLALQGVTAMRVFIDAEDEALRAVLRDALFMHTACACVEADGQWRMLAKAPITPVGFADDEALLPAEPSEHGAYRLLSEYFAFPEKFDFFDIDLGALIAAGTEGCPRLTLRLAVVDAGPGTAAARVLRTLTEAHLALGCTPVVNLFEQTAKPIRVTSAGKSYPVVLDGMPASDYEIYSVDAVQLVRKTSQGSSVTEFSPYHSLHEGGQGRRKDHYWLLNRDDCDAGANRNASLVLVDQDLSPLRMEDGATSVLVTCTNRNIPYNLHYGRTGGDLRTVSAGVSFPIRMLRRPTMSHRQASQANSHWGLIAHLAPNHRALTQHGLPALAKALRLYARPDNATAQRQIEGITGLSHRPATAWLRQDNERAYMRGIEVKVTLDEKAFAGTGIHVFAQMLDHLFCLNVHLNSYTQLVIVSHSSGKEVLKCQPRIGALALA
jgi:type VI secretion system protein ImpG